MIVRQQLDIGWGDLAAGLVACLGAPRRHELERRLAACWPAAGATVVPALSVRSGLDALLSVLGWPAGSEVLVSAITLGDMLTVLEAHDLVPVPVDLDPERMAPDEAALEAAVTPRTRALLVAHLFGQRLDLAPLLTVARRHGLLVLEDAAQALAAAGPPSHPESDVALHSFGTIKAATALGGALLTLRDATLARAVARHQQAWPVRESPAHLLRLLRAGLLRLLSGPRVFGAFVGGCRLLGVDHDALLGRAVAGFPRKGLLDALRQRPAPAQLALLVRRLERLDRDALARRDARAEQLLAALGDVPRPGRACHRRGHWVVPVLAEDPDGLVRHLHRRGFDATRGTGRMVAVPPPPGRAEPRRARDLLERLVYLPCHDGLDVAGISRLARAVHEHLGVPGPRDHGTRL